MNKVDIILKLNGKDISASPSPRTTLLDFLREDMGLTGTHMGCEHGICGACSVMMDGEAVRSCLIYAVQADGAEITTVEGLTDAAEPGPLQQAFIDAHGMQCGYCTPGMIVAAEALLRDNPTPSDEDIKEALGGNLCRCTGYAQIVDAVKLAAQKRKAGA